MRRRRSHDAPIYIVTGQSPPPRTTVPSINHHRGHALWSELVFRLRKCADTIGTVLVPWASHFQIIFTDALLSSSTRKLLWFEISKIQFKNKFIVLFTIMFGTLSFSMLKYEYIIQTQ